MVVDDFLSSDVISDEPSFVSLEMMLLAGIVEGLIVVEVEDDVSKVGRSDDSSAVRSLFSDVVATAVVLEEDETLLFAETCLG